MKKRITFLCIFITLVFSLFGIEKKVIETREDPVIKEVVEKEPHKIICTNGKIGRAHV